MKKQFVILFIVITLNLFSQENKSIIGKWKVIIVESEDFYLKTTNDSISLTEKYKEFHSNKIEIENYIKMVKLAYLKNIFIFDKDGNFNQTSDLATFKSKYKIIENENLIEVKDTGLNGENVKFEMPYRIENEYLYITLIQSATKFILMRE